MATSSTKKDTYRPLTRKRGSVDISELMRELYLRDVSAPQLLRFPQILDNRIEKISNSFAIASKEYEYEAQHYIVYPIKVNQMRQVVEEIVSRWQAVQHRTGSGFKAGTACSARHQYRNKLFYHLQRLQG